ncbi:MAG: hypothetical protein IJ057_04845 [Bacteroidales bacterium]|nr:hypothetical protein [Bacteroidales bacterium]
MFNKNKSKFIQKLPLVFVAMVILVSISLGSCKKENLQERTSSQEVVYRSDEIEGGDFSSDTLSAEIMPPFLSTELPYISFGGTLCCNQGI